MASMSGRLTKKNQQMPNLKGYEENHDLLFGVLQSQKPGNDLIQNCDLPPPVKVYAKSDSNYNDRIRKKKNISSLTAAVNLQEEIPVGNSEVGLLKALRLSQTRAREAEAKCASVGKEMDLIVGAFMQDSMQVFGYRQLVRLLEFQVFQLEKKQQPRNQQREWCDHQKTADDDDDDESGSNGVNWMIAFALCLGVAGFGFAMIGCKYYWF